MNTRSAAVALAVTFQVIAHGRFSDLTEDQHLVLRALRRSKRALNTASDEELGAYIRGLDENALRGVVANVKGLYHELLVKRAENIDGDAVTTRLFASLSHPGADLEYVMDGEVVCAVQLKAPAALSSTSRSTPK